MSKKQEMGRLAFRVEGDLWVAYYALPDTMKDALFLGSIRMIFVEDFAAKQTFMALMRDAVTLVIRDLTGARADWPDPEGRPAPEHERSGRA